MKLFLLFVGSYSFVVQAAAKEDHVETVSLTRHVKASSWWTPTKIIDGQCTY